MSERREPPPDHREDTSSSPPFHLAFPVTDLEATRTFYVELLHCRVGRESDRWIDFDFFGHQITAHLAPDEARPVGRNPVDGKQVPVRHFGAVLPWPHWQELADRLRRSGVDFLIEPYIRFEGRTGEQGTMFLTDPSGNGLEFKSFRDARQLFARG